MRALRIAAVLALVLHGVAAAQPTGRIEGRVVDAATGEPLVGGQVRVVETALGNVTRGDGTFFIDRVPIGVQHVETEYLGYQESSREARVLPGRTTRMEFALGGAAIETQAIVATITHEPWIPEVRLPVRTHTVALPDELPETPPISRCEVRAMLHGAYIRDGRWQLHATMGDLRCSSPRVDEASTPCDRAVPMSG